MTIPLVSTPSEKELITLYDVSWDKFKEIEAQLKYNRNIRLSYLSGLLEIMSPIGEKHELVKSTFGLLLEAYMRQKGIRFYRRGGYTLEAPGYASGTPDESYSVGTCGEVPDIVIVCFVINGTIDQRNLYKSKRIPEMWFWKTDQIQIFRLNADLICEETNRSTFFPDLDPSFLLPYINKSDQYDAVEEFVQAIEQ